MKLTEIIVDKVRVGALDIQRHIIEELDESCVGCDLTMDLGFPAVKFTISLSYNDLPYYKEALYMHYGVGIGKAGPGYVAREANKHAMMIGRQHDTVPELLTETIRIIATEGQPDANGNASEKSFGYYFKKAYNFPDHEQGALHDDIIVKVMTAMLKGKRAVIVNNKSEVDEAYALRLSYTTIAVSDYRALMIES